MSQVVSFWRRGSCKLLGGLLLVAGLVACGVAPSNQDAMQAAQTGAPRTPRVESTLGTQWGEGRESVTKVVHASRLTPERPRDVSQLRYSDELSIVRALGNAAERQTNALLADGDVELQVLDGSAAALRIFSTRGGRDFHVAGRHGERYELVYTNRSNRFYEVVTTVDGLDVLSGQPGSVHSGGYLLRPGERLVIDGFRKNDREVAAFRFAGKGRAYANNTPAGDARNVGVIGTALFDVRLDERDPDLPRRSAPGLEPRDPRDPVAFPADGRQYAPPPQYRR